LEEMTCIVVESVTGTASDLRSSSNTVPVLGCSEPPCNMALFVGKMLFFEEVGSSSVELDPIGPSTLAIGSNSELFGSFLDMSPEGPGFGSISEFSGSSAFCGLS